MNPEFLSYFETRFSDFDANGHVRNTAFSEFATQARMDLLTAAGITAEKLRSWQVGPIMFREELQFRREITAFEKVKVASQWKATSESRHKWSFEQQIYRQDGELSAIVSVDGAWMDLTKRKVAPPEGALKAAIQRHFETQSN